MEMITTDGVVLARTFVGEKDAIITILTTHAGIISASAKGIKNMKSKLSAGCAVFTFSEFLLRHDRGKYVVASAKSKDGFYGLSSHIERLSFATYIAELTRSFALSAEDAKTVLPLVLNTLYLLANTAKNMRLIKCVFELRLLCLLGYAPELDACCVCGDAEALCFFSPSLGGVVCRSCVKAVDACIITPDAHAAMLYAQGANDKKAFAFTLAPADIDEFERCTESMCETILGRRLASLNYLKQITGKI